MFAIAPWTSSRFLRTAFSRASTRASHSSASDRPRSSRPTTRSTRSTHRVAAHQPSPIAAAHRRTPIAPRTTAPMPRSFRMSPPRFGQLLRRCRLCGGDLEPRVMMPSPPPVRTAHAFPSSHFLMCQGALTCRRRLPSSGSGRSPAPPECPHLALADSPSPVVYFTKHPRHLRTRLDAPAPLRLQRPNGFVAISFPRMLWP